jgi:putative endonuclease
LAAAGWHVYILRCADGTLYTGIAVDLRKRVEAHQRGTAARYTRARLPVSLAYQESQPDRSSALKREAALRRMGREYKLALIGTSTTGPGDR